jgi:L-asparaginase
MASTEGKVVVLGTGGTIAGTAADAADNVGYSAAQLGVGSILAALPQLADLAIECEQVAQVDSKDMDHALWLRLATRVAQHLARPEVDAVVITHGTDTLEETAYFLHRVLAPAKPVILTAAMRPATSLQADGPQNLLDAVTLAREPGVRGVLAVLAGRVFAGSEVRKVHSYRLDAFDTDAAGPIAVVEEGRVRRFRDWPHGQALGLAILGQDAARWPRVVVLTSHAGADGAVADALVAAGVHGIVVAGTGNGTVHASLEAALRRAARQGVAVARVSRCAYGGIVGAVDTGLAALPALSAPQARIELMLQRLPPRAEGARPARACCGPQATLSATSMLPRVAFE